MAEVLFTQMLFLHLLHCHTACNPKSSVAFHILPGNSTFLNSHLSMFLPTYRKHVQKYLLQIHLNIWLQNYFQLWNILPTIYGIFYFPRLILRFQCSFRCIQQFFQTLSAKCYFLPGSFKSCSICGDRIFLTGSYIATITHIHLFPVNNRLILRFFFLLPENLPFCRP